MRLLPKLKIIRSHDFGWAHSCFELFYFCIIAHSLEEKYMRQRQDLCLFMFLQFIFLGTINFSSQSWVLSCFPLFFPLSCLSLIYFLVFSLIATVSWDIIKLKWLTSPASVVAYRYFGLHSLDHMTLLFQHIWKERKIWDIPQSELMAQL